MARLSRAMAADALRVRAGREVGEACVECRDVRVDEGDAEGMETLREEGDVDGRVRR